MRKKYFHDYKQLEIPFDEAIWRIDSQKRRRELELINKTKFFKNKADRDFLLKITFDITDKDFEYFCEMLLREELGFAQSTVIGGVHDNGQDIYAIDKEGVTYSVQCKQWTETEISLKQIGEYFGQTFFLRKHNQDRKFIYITTSFLSNDAKDFLDYYKVGYFDNTKLVQLAKKHNFFDETNWGKIVEKIKNLRTKKTPLQNLKTQRLDELTHHLPKYMHSDNVKISGAFVKTDHPFFKDWNLV